MPFLSNMDTSYMYTICPAEVDQLHPFFIEVSVLGVQKVSFSSNDVIKTVKNGDH